MEPSAILGLVLDMRLGVGKETSMRGSLLATIIGSITDLSPSRALTQRRGAYCTFVRRLLLLTIITLPVLIASWHSSSVHIYAQVPITACTGQAKVDGIRRGALPFSEGLSPISVSGRWGVIGRSGNMVVSPQFEYIDSFSNGLAFASSAHQSGYIDKTGRFVIETEVRFGPPFSDGLAPVVRDGRYGYVDTNGVSVHAA
jgi:hypothetical protein